MISSQHLVTNLIFILKEKSVNDTTIPSEAYLRRNSPFFTYLWVPKTSTEIRIGLLVIYDH